MDTFYASSSSCSSWMPLTDENGAFRNEFRNFRSNGSFVKFIFFGLTSGIQLSGQIKAVKPRGNWLPFNFISCYIVCLFVCLFA